MEVAFYTMANAYEAVVYIASEDADLKTKATSMKPLPLPLVVR